MRSLPHSKPTPSLFPQFDQLLRDVGRSARECCVAPHSLQDSLRADPDQREKEETEFTPINRVASAILAENVVLSETPTVLLVDDDDMVRGFIATALKRLGYQVYQANHGEDGIEKFTKHQEKIDVIVSDVLMPNLTGPEKPGSYSLPGMPILIYRRNLPTIFPVLAVSISHSQWTTCLVM